MRKGLSFMTETWVWWQMTNLVAQGVQRLIRPSVCEDGHHFQVAKSAVSTSTKCLFHLPQRLKPDSSKLDFWDSVPDPQHFGVNFFKKVTWLMKVHLHEFTKIKRLKESWIIPLTNRSGGESNNGTTKIFTKLLGSSHFLSLPVAGSSRWLHCLKRVFSGNTCTFCMCMTMDKIISRSMIGSPGTIVTGVIHDPTSNGPQIKMYGSCNLDTNTVFIVIYTICK